MSALKKYSRVLLLFINIPFAITNAAKQRLRKKAKIILNTI